MSILEFIRQPWPWYISGIFVALIMLFLIFFGKSFGFSSNLKTICSMCGAGRYSKYFQYNWRDEIWNLLFLIGAILGGFVAQQWLTTSQPVQISSATIHDLNELGFSSPKNLQPEELYGLSQLGDPKVLSLLIIGGLLIGFGTRWAGGCTSGHAISGLSNLQLPSLIAVIGFFAGGMLMTFFIYPLIF